MNISKKDRLSESPTLAEAGDGLFCLMGCVVPVKLNSKGVGFEGKEVTKMWKLAQVK